MSEDQMRVRRQELGAPRQDIFAGHKNLAQAVEARILAVELEQSRSALFRRVSGCSLCVHLSYARYKHDARHPFTRTCSLGKKSEARLLPAFMCFFLRSARQQKAENASSRKSFQLTMLSVPLLRGPGTFKASVCSSQRVDAPSVRGQSSWPLVAFPVTAIAWASLCCARCIFTRLATCNL